MTSGRTTSSCPSDGEGFELRLAHHDLAMLNEPGAVVGEYVSLGIVKSDDIKVERAG